MIFFLLGRGNQRLAAAWLMAASIFFYGWWNKSYVVLLLCSIIFNYCMGTWIGRNLITRHRLARFILSLGVTADLLLLGYYKYANFFLSQVHLSVGEIILPLGISFFTFTQIAYLADVYRGEVKEYNFLHYGTFVTYFPHLIAGPLYHHKEIIPQFAQPAIYRANCRDISIGFSIFFVGLFKKVVLADSMSPFASQVFSGAAHGDFLTFFESWVGALAFTLQIYFDFSGYSDMAIGLSRLFGVKLPLNFNSPYKAPNIIHFWRRWHITLSRFLRDYLYIPMGGNRKGFCRRYLNVMITMLLGGLWHGAGWTFIIWGGLHGLYLVINHAWHGLRRALGQDFGQPSRCGNFLSRGITFLAVVFGWVFFRAESLEDALRIIKGMACLNGMALPTAWQPKLGKIASILMHLGVYFDGNVTLPNHHGLLLMIFFLIIAWAFPNTQEIFSRFEPGINFLDDRLKLGLLQKKLLWQPSLSWSLVMGCISAYAVIYISGSSVFLYFQF